MPEDGAFCPLFHRTIEMIGRPGTGGGSTAYGRTDKGRSLQPVRDAVSDDAHVGAAG